MKENRDILLEQLNRKREEIEQTLERFLQNQRENNTRITNDDLRDESDHAQREVFFHSNYSLIEKKTRELKEIECLIQKISRDDRYGVCEECGEPIPPERLLIVPETLLCVECQRELEKCAHSRKHAGRIRSAFAGEREQESEANVLDIVEDELMDFDPDLFPPPEGLSPEIQGPEKTA